MKIFKYPLQIIDRQILKLPVGARKLSVQNQGGFVCLWALVDPNAEKRPVEIFIYGTGNPIDQDITRQLYIDTVQQGQFVWHVFAEE